MANGPSGERVLFFSILFHGLMCCVLLNGFGNNYFMAVWSIAKLLALDVVGSLMPYCIRFSPAPRTNTFVSSPNSHKLTVYYSERMGHLDELETKIK